MKIEELEKLNNNVKAYVLGLIFPLFKIIEKDNKKYYIGSINYNSITLDEKLLHFKNIISFFKKNGIVEDIIFDNSKISGARKKGFSVLVEYIEEKTTNKLFKMVENIQNNKNKIESKYFSIGVLDGRSSWDKNSYLSVDCDRDLIKKELIFNIFLTNEYTLQINNRDIDSPKNDQLRLHKRYFEDFLKNGLFSPIRNKILEDN